MEMIELTNIDDGVRPLLAVTAAAAAGSSSSDWKRPPVFRKVALSVRFGLRLRRIRRRLPVHRTASSSSYTTVEIHSGEEEERENKKKRLKRILLDKDLDALSEFGGVERVALFLNSESESQQPQLTANEDLEQSVRGVGFWGSLFLSSKEFGCYLFNSLTSYSILFLLIAADLSFAIGLLEQGLKDGWHDGVGILIAVLVLVLFSSIVRFYRKREKEKVLLKMKNKLEVTVERNGKHQMVSVFDVKEGEIIHLKKGDRVPADGLLIKGNNMILDEVIYSNIDSVRNPFLFSGSVVANGDGDMIAVLIGADMVAGKGLLDMVSHPSQETLFQSMINKPYKFIEKVSLVVSLMVLFVVLTRLLCGKHDDYYNDKPEIKGKLTVSLVSNVFEMMYLKLEQRGTFLSSVLITMVIGLQHGMPIAITVSLSFWRQKMRSHGGECQSLSACGTLGLVSAICIDITGELSFQEVVVEEIFIGDEKINSSVEFHPDIHEGFEQTARVLFLDSIVTVPLRKSLLTSFENSGLRMNLESLHHKFQIIDHKVLSSSNGALMRRTGDTEANFHLHYNGNASTILNMCSQYYDIRGTIHDIEQQRELLEGVINDMATKGLRPIAFACKQANELVFEETRLKLLGFVGLKCSCRKLKTALMNLKNIGVRVILTSEDELSVAKTMAGSLGIQCGLENQAVEGKLFRETMEIAGIKKDELMKSISVMAKATSDDKLLLLEVLKDGGKIVVSLGGLTSRDAPTLIKADIGMTQINTSTDVCRMVSDLICEDPTSLNRILVYGRCAYLNIRRFYQVQLTASITGLLITLIYTMASGKSPITTLHLIWVTLIMCLLGSIMMIMELNDEEVKDPIVGNENQSLITKLILKKIAFHVLSQVLIFFLLEYLGKKIMPHMEEDVRHTMIFNTFILCQIANLLAAMGIVTNVVSVLKVVLQRFWFLISLVVVLAVQVMVIEFAATVVNGVKLNAAQWTICFSSAFTLGWAWYIFFHFFLY